MDYKPLEDEYTSSNEESENDVEDENNNDDNDIDNNNHIENKTTTENTQVGTSDTCCVCNNAKADLFLLPCGHLENCITCWYSVYDDRNVDIPQLCFICRTPVTEKHEVRGRN